MQETAVAAADPQVSTSHNVSVVSRRPVALITGGASGLGAELVKALRLHYERVIFDIAHGDDVRNPPDMREALRELGEDRLDVLINCAGINRIQWLDAVTEADWDMVLDTNAKGIFMMARACLPLLKESRGTIANIVSNASHMPMTCSAAYNASKGAAHILTLQLARELTPKHGITVFGVSPNKLHGTGMSHSIDAQVVATRGWTPEYAREYQLKALLSGAETPPEACAEFIAFLLSSKERHRYLTGCILPYGA